MSKYLIILIIGFLALSDTVVCEENQDKTIIARHDYLRDFPAFNNEGLVNIVVEIPAGCNQKWEVDKDTGYLGWEKIGSDSLRVVKYLPYPANYGMVPRTWLPINEGGDDDPLDIFLLGQAVERGSVVPGKIIGVIKMLDKGLQDDKLLAVPVDGLFSDISTLDQIRNNYPGIIEILKIWLTSYKGGGFVEIQEVQDEKKAIDILKNASEAYGMRVSE
jgi:inorganic pyrophosphatase